MDYHIALNHTVEFSHDGVTFGAGREDEYGNTPVYLIFNYSGRVFKRETRKDTWCVLKESEANIVKHKATVDYIPHYEGKGSCCRYIK